MADEYQIHLNFLPVGGCFPNFTVYRKLRASPQESRPTSESMEYRLPPMSGALDDCPSYWVSVDPVDGFERFEAAPNLNRYLTCRVLFWALVAATRRVLPSGQFHIPDNAFIEQVSFVQCTHAEGDERLEVQPYHLRSSRQFGYLLDFRFRLRDGVPFSRKVQQLSLSLDGSFRRNLDYYVDRDSKVRAFLAKRQDVFESLRLPGTDSAIQLDGDFAALRADRLRTKTYVFAGNRESRSQFSGLRDWGPLQPLPAPPRLLFIFREQDRQAARMLAQGLRGSRQRERFSFPGFHALFKCDIQVDSNPIVLPNLHQPAMETALERVKVERQSRPNTLPVLVLPADDDAYVIHKALFSREGIATQVCTLRILQDESSLMWAVANIALQIFCKAGGYPWKVRPAAAERSLIMGISQSHKLQKVDGETIVEKYFAFSVMTDSSGLFQKIQVLGESHDQPDYLTKLRQNLREILNESAGAFSRVVIHTSFKLKHLEIDAIQKTVQEAANAPDLDGCRFAVVKVNHRSRFFGVNRSVNSLVPYEATRVKLGPREYLVWFEGIFPDRPTVTKAFPGPTHLQILRVSDENAISDDSLLQDLVNLSGANWRGFNAKSAPVSVFYCHLVADMVHDFHERGLPLPAVKDIRPWFL
ncbi:MAG: Piwi domain-containing protein [Gammaproteobacteria bacterium]